MAQNQNFMKPTLNDPLPPVQPITQKPEKQNTVKNFIGTAALIVGAFVFALFINTFVFQSYEVDGSSMEPTLQNKDRLIIWKLPRTWAKITRHDYVPDYGDVIVFHKPDGSDEQLIKRVIGLPGDRVVIENGTITVYNESHPQGFRPDESAYGKDLEKPVDSIDTKVGENEIFVSGDNRTPGGSYDSRGGLGNVPMDMVIGKLVLRLFPIQNFETYGPQNID